MSISRKLMRKLPPIPDLPLSADPATRSAFAALKEALEVRLGRRGDPMEEAVTRRQLVDSGIAKLTSPLGTELAPVTVADDKARIIPPVPIGFHAESIFGGVTLTWENPFQAYSVHAYTEVWRGESSDLTKRILIDSSRGSTFFDRLGDDAPVNYWYWVRFVSKHNREGPFSLPRQSAKQEDAAVIMNRISGQIDASTLSAAFRSELDGVADVVQAHNQQIQAHGSSISQQMALINGLSAQYVLKLNVEGYISGIGMTNDGRTSDFAIVTDRFWLAPPDSTGAVKPFVYENGSIYMDTVLIRDGTIQQGKLGPISFGKIIDSAGRSVTTVSGKLRADAIDVASLQVTDANIAGVLKSNALGRNGQPRWMLDKAGGLTMNGAGTGGQLEMRDDVLKVFDGNGQVRVQIGNLSV